MDNLKRLKRSGTGGIISRTATERASDSSSDVKLAAVLQARREAQAASEDEEADLDEGEDVGTNANRDDKGIDDNPVVVGDEEDEAAADEREARVLAELSKIPRHRGKLTNAVDAVLRVLRDSRCSREMSLLRVSEVASGTRAAAALISKGILFNLFAVMKAVVPAHKVKQPPATRPHQERLAGVLAVLQKLFDNATEAAETAFADAARETQLGLVSGVLAGLRSTNDSLRATAEVLLRRLSNSQHEPRVVGILRDKELNTIGQVVRWLTKRAGGAGEEVALTAGGAPLDSDEEQNMLQVLVNLATFEAESPDELDQFCEELTQKRFIKVILRDIRQTEVGDLRYWAAEALSAICSHKPLAARLLEVCPRMLDVAIDLLCVDPWDWLQGSAAGVLGVLLYHVQGEEAEDAHPLVVLDDDARGKIVSRLSAQPGGACGICERLAELLRTCENDAPRLNAMALVQNLLETSVPGATQALAHAQVPAAIVNLLVSSMSEEGRFEQTFNQRILEVADNMLNGGDVELLQAWRDACGAALRAHSKAAPVAGSSDMAELLKGLCADADKQLSDARHVAQVAAEAASAKSARKAARKTERHAAAAAAAVAAVTTTSGRAEVVEAAAPAVDDVPMADAEVENEADELPLATLASSNIEARPAAPLPPLKHWRASPYAMHKQKEKEAAKLRTVPVAATLVAVAQAATAVEAAAWPCVRLARAKACSSPINNKQPTSPAAPAATAPRLVSPGVVPPADLAAAPAAVSAPAAILPTALAAPSAGTSFQASPLKEWLAGRAAAAVRAAQHLPLVSEHAGVGRETDGTDGAWTFAAAAGTHLAGAGGTAGKPPVGPGGTASTLVAGPDGTAGPLPARTSISGRSASLNKLTASAHTPDFASAADLSTHPSAKASAPGSERPRPAAPPATGGDVSARPKSVAAAAAATGGLPTVRASAAESQLSPRQFRSGVAPAVPASQEAHPLNANRSGSARAHVASGGAHVHHASVPVLPNEQSRNASASRPAHQAPPPRPPTSAALPHTTTSSRPGDVLPGAGNSAKQSVTGSNGRPANGANAALPGGTTGHVPPGIIPGLSQARRPPRGPPTASTKSKVIMKSLGMSNGAKGRALIQAAAAGAVAPPMRGQLVGQPPPRQRPPLPPPPATAAPHQGQRQPPPRLALPVQLSRQHPNAPLTSPSRSPHGGSPVQQQHQPPAASPQASNKQQPVQQASNRQQTVPQAAVRQHPASSRRLASTDQTPPRQKAPSSSAVAHERNRQKSAADLIKETSYHTLEAVYAPPSVSDLPAKAASGVPAAAATPVDRGAAAHHAPVPPAFVAAQTRPGGQQQPVAAVPVGAQQAHHAGAGSQSHVRTSFMQSPPVCVSRRTPPHDNASFFQAGACPDVGSGLPPAPAAGFPPATGAGFPPATAAGVPSVITAPAAPGTTRLSALATHHLARDPRPSPVSSDFHTAQASGPRSLSQAGVAVVSGGGISAADSHLQELPGRSGDGFTFSAGRCASAAPAQHDAVGQRGSTPDLLGNQSAAVPTGSRQDTAFAGRPGGSSGAKRQLQPAGQAATAAGTLDVDQWAEAVSSPPQCPLDVFAALALLAHGKTLAVTQGSYGAARAVSAQHSGATAGAGASIGHGHGRFQDDAATTADSGAAAAAAAATGAASAAEGIQVRSSSLYEALAIVTACIAPSADNHGGVSGGIAVQDADMAAANVAPAAGTSHHELADSPGSLSVAMDVAEGAADAVQSTVQQPVADVVAGGTPTQAQTAAGGTSDEPGAVGISAESSGPQASGGGDGGGGSSTLVSGGDGTTPADAGGDGTPSLSDGFRRSPAPKRDVTGEVKSNTESQRRHLDDEAVSGNGAELVLLEGSQSHVPREASASRSPPEDGVEGQRSSDVKRLRVDQDDGGHRFSSHAEMPKASSSNPAFGFVTDTVPPASSHATPHTQPTPGAAAGTPAAPAVPGAASPDASAAGGVSVHYAPSVGSEATAIDPEAVERLNAMAEELLDIESAVQLSEEAEKLMAALSECLRSAVVLSNLAAEIVSSSSSAGAAVRQGGVAALLRQVPELHRRVFKTSETVMATLREGSGSSASRFLLRQNACAMFQAQAEALLLKMQHALRSDGSAL